MLIKKKQHKIRYIKNTKKPLKFTTEKETFLSALQEASQVVPIRTTLPVLSCAFLGVSKEKLTIKTTDLEQTIISKTEIKTFESIDATKVVVASKKLYVNREEGFIGTAMRKDEFVCDCSDIDDIIVFRRNGTMQVVRVDNKVFVGKDIIHCAVFKKKDERTIYNMIYKDGKSNITLMKRFSVTSITRGKEYELTKSDKGSKVLYFTANPNGEAETVTVNLRKLQKLKS